MAGEEAAFREFFERQHGDLARLAYLLTGEADVADGLAADALAELRRHWLRAEAGDGADTYARRAVTELARRWMRRQGRHRNGRHRAGAAPHDGGLDVRAALLKLPHRRRACVVLRAAFDVPEQEIAKILGVSVGSVRRQTARGERQLAELS
ncbi:sigma factor-like helix-turn-helix DNA-binding protein [Actinoplanes sp. N902-109]|uniref:sigma factor-like helix-turn-helix DNA-binding protein n=1 Tax=Actinoplanes sp. (strain N902-109) TaxID=649831 RepID=UPI0003295352|nr:sigma factor-like helix-turn-helix DNA-binding protein [Actinoplanes sp. N902-109]AGL17256.1 RNA polymerase sigma factor [Actinoplanes sp. N902-109]